MKKDRKFNFFIVLSILILMTLQNCSTKEDSSATYYSMDDYQNIEKYDVHVHVMTLDSSFVKASAEDNFKLLTINVDVPYYPSLEDQQHYALHQSKAFPDHLHYATAFTVNNWEDENWQKTALDYLKQSFSNGAIAVKVWKNIGMELKDQHGDFVMINDARFDAIFNYLEENNITLIGHLGEPKNCWLPVEEMTVTGDKNYFATHPEYHMYLHPEYPSYEDQLNFRDKLLEKHPDLKFVGAHLGSLEWSVDALAKRLDQYPNMAVDMAARISHLQYQAVTDWQKVHDFFIKYQDRILYGTDLQADDEMSPEALKKEAHEIRLRHWKFFTSDETMSVPKVEDEFKGLRLPKQVIDKIYRENAKKWFSGL
ncbi:amidohydrolase family protein [Catalinimonas sp. 4WD22]|uniref:amidohydrolase family protein n=1 Tax=Catalinimonas locisalis TaxID=3133978 RepID=UPI00310101D8